MKTYYANADICDSASPSNFFIYRTAKIILVPPVTDSNGHVACATTSTFFPSTLGSTASPILFPGINSNAENYFDGPSATQAAHVHVAADISLTTPYLDKLPTPALATNLASDALPTTGIFTQRAFDGLRGKEPRPSDDGTEADYGYVNPFFIKFLAQNSDYAKQYPQIATCLPGGPSIDPNTRTADLVATPSFASAVTNTVVDTTYASGCFNTDSSACSTAVSNPLPPPQPVTTPASSPAQELQPTPSNQNTPAPALSTPPAQNSPTLNPSSLSPEQLSQLFNALSVSTPAAISPAAISSAAPSGPPISSPSFQTSPSPPLISSSPAGEVTPAPSESLPATSVQTAPPAFTGKAGRKGREPLWSLLAFSLGLGLMLGF